jgi:hypothetical protein
MTIAACLSLLYCSALLAFGADRAARRGARRWPLLSTPPRVWTARVLALGAALLGGALWARIEPGPASWFMVIVGLMAMGTLVALVAPFAPRLLWRAGAVSAALLVLLALAVVGGIG